MNRFNYRLLSYVREMFNFRWFHISILIRLCLFFSHHFSHLKFITRLIIPTDWSYLNEFDDYWLSIEHHWRCIKYVFMMKIKNVITDNYYFISIAIDFGWIETSEVPLKIGLNFTFIRTKSKWINSLRKLLAKYKQWTKTFKRRNQKR